jgi:hypothetical protein
VSDEPSNPLNDLLSGFELGPAWAKAKSGDSQPKYKDGGEREYKPRRNDDRRGGGDRRDSRQGGGRDRDDRRGGGNRRDFKGGGGGRDRRDFQREEIAPAPGITVTLVPEKSAIQLVCKEVHQVARAYPLFDIAQIILAERNRSRAIFEASEKTAPFYRCKIEEAIYLTKEEAIAHLLQADWRNRFIEETTVEVEAPKGNFQAVARCGLSGQLLGPPNHHSYQTNLRTLHREAFSNMPFEAYAAKARTERSEEAVNAWLESMKIQTRWRVLSDAEIATRTSEAEKATAQAEAPKQEDATVTPTGRDGLSEPSASDAPTTEPAPETPAESTEETVVENAAEPATEETTENPVTEASTQEETSEEVSTEVAETETTPAPDELTWFTDRAEFDRALASEVLEKAFHLTRKAKVAAAIPGKHLSPGLLVRLKGTGSHHRKHPAIVIPVICKILEAEHMPVFKRKGKLFTGPARPKPLSPDAVLAPRPAEMVAWIRANTPAKLDGLWKAVLPEGATAPSADYAADLFWLLQQGHILLYTDDTLAVQEKPKPQEPKKPKAPKEKKPTAEAKAPAEDSEVEIADAAPAESPEEPAAEALEAPAETPAQEAPAIEETPAAEQAEPSTEAPPEQTSDTPDDSSPQPLP